MGSFAHYADTSYYESSYKKRTEDVAFYLAMALEQGGPVLEYGTGSGRIALPMARHGISVFGIDHSETMLTHFREALAGEKPEVQRRVQLLRGDMRTTALKKKYPQVFCTFNTALHLYTRQDVEAFLARVKAHLAPGGRFIVDLSMPHAIDLARPADEAHSTPRFNYPGEGVVKYKEYFDYDPLSQVLHVDMVFEPYVKAGAKKSPKRKGWTTPLTHRQFFPQEWEALLHYNGFEVISTYGDFEASPLTRESDTMIWIAKARGR